jgi:GrpB-like predicted nucleotidyltransferase (UPF0157 family)
VGQIDGTEQIDGVGAVDRALTERIATTQEELDSAWVDGPPPPSKPVVVDYDTGWPALYQREEQRIRSLLGDQVLDIAHVGSTAVPGLAAKAIIDIDLVVPDSAAEDAYLPVLIEAGYMLRVREPNWHEHRYLKGPDTNINLHVFSPGCPEVTRHQVFRDWLRSHDQDRDRYATVKRELAAVHHDVRDYADAKNAIIDDIYARAFARRDAQ